MTIMPSLVLALILLSPPSLALCAPLAVTAVPPPALLHSGIMLHLTGNRPAKAAAVEPGLLQLAAGPADSGGNTAVPGEVLELRSFAFYALSRGRGVSERGQKGIADFRELLRQLKAEGQAVEVTDKRIGIEGETKICASFASAELAGKAWLQMQSALAGADLVQLKPEKC